MPAGTGGKEQGMSEPNEAAHLSVGADIPVDGAVDVCNLDERVVLDRLTQLSPGGGQALAVACACMHGNEGRDENGV